MLPDEDPIQEPTQPVPEAPPAAAEAAPAVEDVVTEAHGSARADGAADLPRADPDLDDCRKTSW